MKDWIEDVYLGSLMRAVPADHTVKLDRTDYGMYKIMVVPPAVRGIPLVCRNYQSSSLYMAVIMAQDGEKELRNEKKAPA